MMAKFMLQYPKLGCLQLISMAKWMIKTQAGYQDQVPSIKY